MLKGRGGQVWVPFGHQEAKSVSKKGFPPCFGVEFDCGVAVCEGQAASSQAPGNAEQCMRQNMAQLVSSFAARMLPQD